ncbi:MAG: hemolysin family protein [Gammaproteobacteria bacterium]|jgi:CBS domain containing-hemolysin-like protein
MTDTLLTLLVMLICLVAEAFFSGSEIGVVSADRIKLRHQAAKGSRGARLALDMLKEPEWLLSTTLVGTNIAVVTNTTMATALMLQLFGPGGSWLAIVLVAPLIWVFGEIVPKSVFQHQADSITLRSIFILKFCSYLFYPILVVFSSLARLLGRVLGGRADAQNPFTLREEIMTMMRMSSGDGDIAPIEQNMIRRLFNFGETTAHEVMMPLIDVTMVERSADCATARRVASRYSHARIPVYQERVDHVVGVLDTLELLGVEDSTPIQSFIKPVSYAPGNKSIQDLLLDMRRAKEQVIVVVDEFGGAEGIVSLEDILEEVVEDIKDEYDAGEREVQLIRRLDDGTLIANARVDLGELADELDLELPRGRYASLAGFLLEKAGDIPPVGSTIRFREMKFTVLKGNARSIQEVKISF